MLATTSSIETPATFAGTLLPHQLDALAFVVSNPRCLNAMGVGLGKTWVNGAYLAYLKDAGELTAIPGGPRAVYVTANSVVPQTVTELRRMLPGLTIVAVHEVNFLSKPHPSVKDCDTYAQAYGDGPDIIVCGIEWLTSRIETSAHWWAPALLVLDEAGRLTGDGAGQAAARALSQCSERCVGATATPYRSNALQTYRILEAIGTPGLWSYADFTQRIVHMDDYQPSPWAKVTQKARDGFRTPEAEQEFKTYLHENMVRITVAHTGMPLPRIAYPAPVMVSLPSSAQRTYDAADRTGKGVKALERIGRGMGTESNLPAAVADQLTGPYEGRRALIWSTHPEVLGKVAAALAAVGISSLTLTGYVKKDERSKALARFKEGEVSVLLGSDVLEVGLNMQDADCDLLISLDCSEVPDKEQQREGRLARIGSPFDTITHLYLLPDTPVVRAKWTKLGRRRVQAEWMLSPL